jgi:hypothetical protein
MRSTPTQEAYCEDGKNGENTSSPFLDLNLVRYATLKYAKYMACIEANPLRPRRDSSDASGRIGCNVGRVPLLALPLLHMSSHVGHYI